uniref:Uncharacterized protein n=1 Tax=Nelumbo nucifera TaxID=4432 RepID=A0A822YHH5_NELNU|nr:TPA_asm: hypothetical protein HUJ06_010743 [Nelumbo nucifera]
MPDDYKFSGQSQSERGWATFEGGAILPVILLSRTQVAETNSGKASKTWKKEEWKSFEFDLTAK